MRSDKEADFPIDMVRLEPMSPGEFQDFLQRAIARHAADNVRRGVWEESAALEASRGELNQYLPQGRETPGHHFAKVVDESNGQRVGETFYSVREQGGKIQFLIDWIWTEPEFRGRGFATAVIQHLSQEAAQRGADRVDLWVFSDNPGALSVYSKTGFVTTTMRMTRPLSRGATE